MNTRRRAAGPAAPLRAPTDRPGHMPGLRGSAPRPRHQARGRQRRRL